MGEYGGDSGRDGGGALRRGATLTFLWKSYIKREDTPQRPFNPVDLRNQTLQLHILPCLLLIPLVRNRMNFSSSHQSSSLRNY